MQDFEVIYYRHNEKEIPPKMTLNKVFFYELTFLKKGNFTYYVNGEKIILKENDAVLVRPNQLRRRSFKEEVTDYISFNFLTEHEIPLPTHIQGGLSREVAILILASDEIKKNTYTDANTLISPVLASIVGVLLSAQQIKNENPLTTQIKKFLHDNLSDKISLEDVSKLTFYSPIYLENVFKKDTGKSIIDYLLTERLLEAKRLIAEGILSLSKVAESVGIYDYNYFSRVFKKRIGYTPTQYKNQFAKKK